MTTKDDALKLALEALEYDGVLKRRQAITAIKEALADSALERMAENAREIGLDYEPAQQSPKWHGVRFDSALHQQPAQQPKLSDYELDGMHHNKLHKCKYPNCDYPCPDLPDCRDAEQPAQQEPTKAMIDAAERIDWSDSDVRGNIVNMWQAMCAAAPRPAQQEPEFFTHNVEQPYDWSEWVCPDPKNYLMKCCDCGLVHEAQFGVVRYKSDTEREDCDMVDDPNLQAVFRMRRSEQWSPEDTAHRAGGLPHELP